MYRWIHGSIHRSDGCIDVYELTSHLVLFCILQEREMREEKARNKNVKLHRMSSKGGIKRTHVYRKERARQAMERQMVKQTQTMDSSLSLDTVD